MASRLKSLIITIAVHHFPPTFKGGAEWRAHRTAKWLQNQGHRVKVICVEAVNDPAVHTLRWEDDTFDSLPVRRLYLNLSNAPDPVKWEYHNLWIEAHISKYLAEERPGIFHIISGYLMTAGAIKAAKELGLPVVITLTDFWFLCHRITLQRASGEVCEQNRSLDCARCMAEQKRRYRLPAQKAPALSSAVWQSAQKLPLVSTQVTQFDGRASALRAALQTVDVAIAPSKFLKQVYQRRGFTAQQMIFQRQGLARLPKLPLRKTDSPHLRVGYIGQIAQHKGVHVLIDAFLQLNSPQKAATLKLYGDTSQFPKYYNNLQTKLRDEIQFMGTFDNRQINKIYEDIDVIVVPSIWYENSPNVILEAYAYKTPVIASNLGGMAELVAHNKTGLLFEAGNPQDLAQKLQLVLAQQTLLKSWQESILPVLSVAEEMTALTDIYHSVVQGQVNFDG